MKNKGILILTPFFSPNIGGVETHFDDLIMALDRRGYFVYVKTYSPITTSGVIWKAYEKLGNNIFIQRYRWFGKNLFHKLEKFPLFDFLYITPYLFVRTFIWLLFNKEKIDVIHAQGFNAAWMGVIFKKLFKKRLIVSTHAIYEIDKNSKTAKRIISILNNADKVLMLSRGSYDELTSFGLDKEKVDLYKYWINLEKFKPLNKIDLRKELNIKNNFTVLFVGRLIEKKGIRILIDVAKKISDINFIFIGNGPEESFLKSREKEMNNVRFIGAVPNSELYKYYNIADIFCIPSQYEEGFGRVVIEAVACGLPVVGSNKGGIPEALDETVSILIDPNVDNITQAISELYNHKEKYLKLANNTRSYAEKNFSEENINLITKYY
jgi:glycosyltransferase involved in cell wall biosynthesis